jgi:RNA polymerase sigma-70 factor (ECF subfamily)
MEKNLDKKLYNDYLNGEKEAFNFLYNKYKSKIEYFIYNIVKDYQKAEDLTQETFIYVMQNEIKENCSFKYYVYLIAKSKAFNYINVENRRNEIKELYLDNNEEIEKDVLEIITKEETKKEVLEAIELLDEEYKNAIYLVNVEGLSYKETAEILGESVQNIKNLVHRGKKQLKKILLKKGFNEMNKVSKVIVFIVCTGIIVSGVVFAKDIQDFVKNLIPNIFGTYNDGISTAIENGYEAEIDMDFVSSNGVNVKIDSLLLDDYNLGIIYNLEITDNQDLKKLNISRIGFKNLLIMDENNNILQAEYEDINAFAEYCKENNLDTGRFGTGFSNGETIKKIIQKSNNNSFLVSDLITSEKFPNSKKLYISFDAIYFMNSNAFYCAGKVYKNNKIGEKEANKKDYVVVNGDWKFEIDLDEIAQKRKLIEYSVTDINDNNTTVSKAELSMTNMKLELITNSDKIDFEKLKSEDKELMNVADLIPFNEVYIETSDGTKFFEIGENGYDNLEDGKIKYYTTFDYTYFDKEENIKIVLTTNKKEELVIEMKADFDE